jgi:hypothetical protein
VKRPLRIAAVDVAVGESRRIRDPKLDHGDARGASLKVLSQIPGDHAPIAGGGAGDITVGSNQPSPVLSAGRTELWIEHCRELFDQSSRGGVEVAKRARRGDTPDPTGACPTMRTIRAPGCGPPVRAGPFKGLLEYLRETP